MTNSLLSCKETLEIIDVFLDEPENAASPQMLDTAAKSHLDTCQNCATYFSQTTAILNTLENLDNEESLPLPAGLTDSIMDRIAHEKVVPLKRKSTLQKYWPIAAAVLAVALASPLLLNTPSPENIAITETTPEQTETVAVNIPAVEPTPVHKNTPVQKASAQDAPLIAQAIPAAEIFAEDDLDDTGIYEDPLSDVVGF